jgi:tRNA (cmo5U34)-methyltransferase
MTVKTHFSFAEHAPTFRNHISSSIPGYKGGLLPTCVSLTRRFVQPETRVIDIGCSTGHLLASVRRANQTARPDVEYIGIDIEPGFSVPWNKFRAKNLHFEVADARTYQGYVDLSVVLSIFTLQFIRPVDKQPLLKRVYDGLVEGGALLIAEKVFAETARFQDALTFPYYDYKLGKGFSPQHILDKERSLRGQMTLWTEVELRSALCQAGFREIQSIWRSAVFVGLLVLK